MKKIFFILVGILMLMGNNIPVSFAQDNLGRIPVLEYHSIGTVESRWTRSITSFKKDLEWLYNNDYRLVSAEDAFINKIYPIEKGKKPVVITFDDSNGNQFKYLQNGLIDPDCGIGILDEFYEKYPDFGRAVTFFVLPKFFEQKELKEKKLKYLLETGRQIGNHTYSHSKLSEVDPVKPLGRLNNYLLELGVDNIITLAYPHGLYPKSVEGLAKVAKGTYGNIDYEIKLAFLVGAQPAYHPNDLKFDALKIHRIQAIDDEWKRHFDRNKGETEKLRDENFKPFLKKEEVDILNVNNEKSGPTLFFGWPELVQEKEVLKIDSKPKDVLNLKSMGNEKKQFEFGMGSVLNMVKNFTNRFEVRSVPEGLFKKKNNYVYVVKKGDDWNKIVTTYMWVTEYYLEKEFKKAFRDVNGLNSLVEGSEVVIPGVEIISYNPLPPQTGLHGIYLTSYSAASKSGIDKVNTLVKNGGNFVVFDIKETGGKLAYNSKLKIVDELGVNGSLIKDVRKWVRVLHKKGVYASARIVMFKDLAVARAKPDWVIKDSRTGRPWSNREGSVWLDPSHPEVQSYLLKLTEEVAKMGVDEIQFDYVRFPALGATRFTDYYYDENKMTRDEVITDFVRKAKNVLKPYGTKLSLDVFGIIAWSNGIDARIVGQNTAELAKYADVICPMIYPSHFGKGYSGHPDPANDPYFFVKESTKKFNALVGGDKSKIRPWFQGFPLRVNNFGSWYMNDQKRALKELGMSEFIVWSPGNYYDVSWGIMGK